MTASEAKKISSENTDAEKFSAEFYKVITKRIECAAKYGDYKLVIDFEAEIRSRLMFYQYVQRRSSRLEILVNSALSKLQKDGYEVTKNDDTDCYIISWENADVSSSDISTDSVEENPQEE